MEKLTKRDELKLGLQGLYAYTDEDEIYYSLGLCIDKKGMENILDFIMKELDKAREEGYEEGKNYQARLDRELYGMSFEKFNKKWKNHLN